MIKWFKQLFCRHQCVNLKYETNQEIEYEVLMNVLRNIKYSCNDCGKDIDYEYEVTLNAPKQKIPSRENFNGLSD